MLDKNPMDQAAWLLKCKALTKKSWVDDLEIDEEGVADILMGKKERQNLNFEITYFSKLIKSYHNTFSTDLNKI